MRRLVETELQRKRESEWTVERLVASKIASMRWGKLKSALQTARIPEVEKAKASLALRRGGRRLDFVVRACVPHGCMRANARS